MSSTSRSFQEVFTHRLGAERKARCDLALQQFGQEQIVAIAELIQRCVEGEAMDPVLGDSPSVCGWMSADGKLHVMGFTTWRDTQMAIRNRGDVIVNIHVYCKRYPYAIDIHWGRDNSQLQLWIGKFESTIVILPSSEEDLAGAALVQVLLNESHGPTFRYGGDPHKIDIAWWVLRGAERKTLDMHRGQVSEEGVQTQSAPLMPRGASQVSLRLGMGILTLWK